jgi:hypothetical protein
MYALPPALESFRGTALLIWLATGRITDTPQSVFLRHFQLRHEQSSSLPRCSSPGLQTFSKHRALAAHGGFDECCL